MKIRLALGITFILAISYSLFIYFAKPQQLLEWVTTVVASGISFFLAIIAGIYLYNQQKSAEESSQAKDLRLLLAAEFSDINRILTGGTAMSVNLPSGKSINVLIAYIQPLVTEKAALSGLYDKLKSENLFHLARKIRIYNTKTDYFLGLLQSNPNENMMIHANQNIEETRIAIIQNIQLIADQFELELSDSHKYD